MVHVMEVRRITVQSISAPPQLCVCARTLALQLCDLHLWNLIPSSPASSDMRNLVSFPAQLLIITDKNLEPLPQGWRFLLSQENPAMRAL